MTLSPQRQVRVETRAIWRVKEAGKASENDSVTVEEPLEIRIAGESVAVIMRTPCHDFELAAGFLRTEGLIDSPGQLGAISYCTAAEPPNEENIVEVKLAAGVEFDLQALRRNFYASSSCGICGKASIEAIACQAPVLAGDFTITVETLYELNDRMRRAQDVFDRIQNRRVGNKLRRPGLQQVELLPARQFVPAALGGLVFLETPAIGKRVFRAHDRNGGDVSVLFVTRDLIVRQNFRHAVLHMRKSARFSRVH